MGFTMLQTPSDGRFTTL